VSRNLILAYQLRERYVKHRVYSGGGEARWSGAVGFC
jgi:hypothetical protein